MLLLVSDTSAISFFCKGRQFQTQTSQTNCPKAGQRKYDQLALLEPEGISEHLLGPTGLLLNALLEESSSKTVVLYCIILVIIVRCIDKIHLLIPIVAGSLSVEK